MKIIKKIIEAIGYKPIKKDLVKNQRLIQSYSFLKFDRLIKKIFEENNIKLIIQIGANDGLRFDEINQIIKDKKVKAILIEPIKKYFDELKKNYQNEKNVFLENYAISSNNEIKKIYKVDEKYLKLYQDHIHGINSFNKLHLINHGVKKNHITSEHVNSLTIIELQKKFNLNIVDIFLIDTEGYDDKIVNDILDSKLELSIIIFEFIHLKHFEFRILLKKIMEKNFKIIALNENLICFKNYIKIL